MIKCKFSIIIQIKTILQDISIGSNKSSTKGGPFKSPFRKRQPPGTSKSPSKSPSHTGLGTLVDLAKEGVRGMTAGIFRKLNKKGVDFDAAGGGD